MTLKSLSFAQISLLGSKHMNQRFITCLYPDSPRISSDPTCPKLSSFSSPQKPVLTLLTSLHQWTIYHSSHFLCFGVISASYKHPHPPNPHWFNFLQFLDSMYMSTSLLQWWLRLFPVLTSLLTMFSILILSFSSSLSSTLQPELSYRQIWWFIHLFDKYLWARYWPRGLKYSPYLLGI